MLEEKGNLLSCPLAYAVSVFGGKWKPFIIWYLSIAQGGACRYGALKASIPYEISHKVMTQQLKELEADGIINRVVFNEVPPHVEYSLTAKGLSLARIIYLLRDWGVAYGDFDKRSLGRTKGTINGRIIEYSNIIAENGRRGNEEKIFWSFG